MCVCVCLMRILCVLGGGGVPTYVQELSSVDLRRNTHTQPKESALRVVNSFWRRCQMKLRLAVSFCDPLCVRAWHRGNGFGARGMGQTHWKWPVCAGVVLGVLRNLRYGAGFRETFCVFGRSFGTCSRRSPAFVMPDLGIVLGVALRRLRDVFGRHLRHVMPVLGIILRRLRDVLGRHLRHVMPSLGIVLGWF